MATDDKKILMYVLIAVVVYMLFFKTNGLYRRRYAMQAGKAPTTSMYKPRRMPMRTNYNLQVGERDYSQSEAESTTNANAALNAAGANLANQTGAGPATLPYKKRSLYDMRIGNHKLANTSSGSSTNMLSKAAGSPYNLKAGEKMYSNIAPYSYKKKMLYETPDMMKPSGYSMIRKSKFASGYATVQGTIQGGKL